MTDKLDQARIEALVVSLRTVPVFTDLPQADLEWFVSQSEDLHVEQGQIFVYEDSPADVMFVMLEGEFRGRRESAGPDSPAMNGQAPTVTGLLPFSRLKVFPLTVRAVSPVHGLVFPSSKFS